MRDEEKAARLSSSLIWRYGPLIAWVGFIFLASSASFSASNTSRVIGPLLVWLFPEISEAALQQTHFFVRKASHFTEYAVLALLSGRAFATFRRWWLAAFALVAAVALLDEYHQSFLASRTGTVYDSLLDMTGGAAALAAVAAWRARRRRSYRPLAR
ncbi:MAG TPA: VanZ family protein [Pyrinomonadaceae bacterium]|jgi:VanZ family protein|nr:VanZ family protein [Pyrinomonadaceae bacterium]